MSRLAEVTLGSKKLEDDWLSQRRLGSDSMSSVVGEGIKRFSTQSTRGSRSKSESKYANSEITRRLEATNRDLGRHMERRHNIVEQQRNLKIELEKTSKQIQILNERRVRLHSKLGGYTGNSSSVVGGESNSQVITCRRLCIYEITRAVLELFLSFLFLFTEFMNNLDLHFLDFPRQCEFPLHVNLGGIWKQAELQHLYERFRSIKRQQK